MSKVLIGIPSPRDIEEVQDSLSKLPADKYYVKYHPEPEAYDLIRDFFLHNGSWEYLVIHPDDLIVHRKGFNILLQDIEQLHPKVISGVCNLDADTMKNFYAVRISKHDPFLYKPHKQQQFGDVRYQIVYTSSFACLFIHRSVVEKIPFRQYSLTFQTALDQSFAEDCEKNHIPMLIDWKAEFEHLEYRLGGGKLESFYKGVKPPNEFFVHA